MPRISYPDYPIVQVLPQLQAALVDHTAAILVAPPGAGKTTLVPLDLLHAPWLAATDKIIVLEPRRLAAQATAERMAALLGEKVGETVGYVVRQARKTSARTRIEVVTEGILTKRILADPGLSGVAAILFDEFHERSLQGDLGLALCKEIQDALNDQLRLVVMSATLETEALQQFFPDAPLLHAAGRMYPVDVHYAAQESRAQTLAADTAATIRDALEHHAGSILAFLPGEREIHDVARRLQDVVADGIDVLPLYGALSRKEQNRAIQPVPAGCRKVVLATDIAETSLTIEGITVVVDSGYRRAMRLDSKSGMGRLETVRISKAAATQRAGRAGRMQAGVCYRLWPKGAHGGRAQHEPPEIMVADLADLALALHGWGVASPADMQWLDAPPVGAYAIADNLLANLGALAADGVGLSSHGQRLAALPLHPRLAHMVVAADQAAKDGILPDYALWCATMLAALLQEKDPLGRGVDAQSADVMLRLKLLQGGNVHGSAAAVQRIQTTQKDIVRRAGFQNTKLFVPSKAEMASAAYADVVGLLLAMAFPDRIAQRRESTDPQPERVSYRFAGARGGWLSGRDPLSQAPYIAVAACGAAATGHRGEGGIYMAAALEIEKIQTVMPWLLRTGAYVHWDAAGQQVKAEEATRIGALVLKSRKLPDPADEAIMEAWRDGVQQQGIAAIPWQKEHVALRQRMAFVHFQSYAVLGADTPWPDVSDAALLERLSEWFLPYIGGLRKWSQLAAVPWGEALKSLLPWDLQRQLDTYAPRHVVVPSGSKVPLDYSTPAAPALHVRLQEMFGACHTPCVGDVAHQQAMPAVPVVMHLLSPAQRPLQVTQNLESFWADGYSHVKAEMKGRYPRHYWPDNPLEAAPTRRSKASMDRQKK